LVTDAKQNINMIASQQTSQLIARMHTDMMEYVVKAAAAAVGGALFALPLLAGKPGTSVGRYVHRALSSLRILIAFWRRAPHTSCLH